MIIKSFSTNKIIIDDIVIEINLINGLILNLSSYSPIAKNDKIKN